MSPCAGRMIRGVTAAGAACGFTGMAGAVQSALHMLRTSLITASLWLQSDFDTLCLGAAHHLKSGTNSPAPGRLIAGRCLVLPPPED